VEIACLWATFCGCPRVETTMAGAEWGAGATVLSARACPVLCIHHCAFQPSCVLYRCGLDCVPPRRLTLRHAAPPGAVCVCRPSAPPAALACNSEGCVLPVLGPQLFRATLPQPCGCLQLGAPAPPRAARRLQALARQALVTRPSVPPGRAAPCTRPTHALALAAPRRHAAIVA
jgi:hypothetical protein